ncbi:caspase, EACC1-associated type [[Actinomadura] parvosata]|uniref:caspase, EACC1-associated type n=1 Tax=[Actinomadura] parvosata TaxID=1955412 RepID=UPI00406C704D
MGRRLALLIATYEYHDPGLQQLTAPAHDAEGLADVLRDPDIAGFEVTTLINQPHYRVGEAIGAFYRDQRRDDLTLLYFTGHGLKDDDGQLYLAMINTRRDNLLFTGLASEQIDRAMETGHSRQKVLVLDCCYSGAFPAGRAKADTTVHALERFQGMGRTVLTASDATQYSFEGSQVHGQAAQSVFTRHLVAGLRDGSADLDGDGDITLDELYSYVHERVVAEMPQQRPKKQANVEGHTVIARNINWTLPTYLGNALASPIATDRRAALDGLAHLYRIGNSVVRDRVHEEIRRLTDDDSKLVSAAATDCLRFVLPHPSQAADQQPPVQDDSPPSATAAPSNLGTAVDHAPAPPRPAPNADASAELEELYTTGLAALYTEQWDTAIEAFHAIVAQDRDYKNCQVKLEQSQRGQQLASLYTAGTAAAAADEWENAIEHWEALLAADPGYRDAAAKLDQARRSQIVAQLHAEAAALHRSGQWQAMQTVGEQLAQLASSVPGPDELSSSTQAELESAHRMQLLATHYQHALQHLDAGRRDQALTSLLALCRIDPDYKDAPALLARIRRELSADTQVSTYFALPQQIIAPKPVNAVTFSPSSAHLALACDGKIALIVDLTGAEQHRLQHAGWIASVWDVAFSPDGNLLATAGGDKKARIWDVTTGTLLLKVTHTKTVNGVSFSPDGRHLATCSLDRSARIWDAATGTPLLKVTHIDPVCGVSFSPDGRHLATASDESAHIWDATTGTLLLKVTHTKTVNGVAFSPDGRHLATASDESAHIWDATTGTQLLRVTEIGPVWRVAFSPDGRHLATASDETAYIWDATTGTPLLRVAHTSLMMAVAFSPDGRHLATCSSNTVQVWQKNYG